MSKLIVANFITLDGVFEAPETWSGDYQSPDAITAALELLNGSEALLLGRVTYEAFAEAWPSRTDPMGFADKMNGMPKYVVSSTLGDPEWNNTTVLAGEPEATVRDLKDQVDGDLLLYGSGTLMRALIAADLVDELRLQIIPAVVADGARLFDGGAPASFAASAVGRFDGGIVTVNLEPAGAGGRS